MSPYKPGTKFERKFTCGHAIKQDHPTEPPCGFNFEVMAMKVSDDCVYCKQMKPTEDFTKSPAQIHMEDQEATKVYKEQFEYFKGRTENARARNATQLAEEMKKQEDYFKLVWAKKIREIEIRETNNLVETASLASLSTALQKKVYTILSKSKILHQAEVIRLERARKAAPKSAPKAITVAAATVTEATTPADLNKPAAESKPLSEVEKLEIRCEKWKLYTEKIKELGEDVMGTLEDEMHEELWGNCMIVAATELEGTWAEVVKFATTSTIS